jgi:hypothetical protein
VHYGFNSTKDLGVAQERKDIIRMKEAGGFQNYSFI